MHLQEHSIDLQLARAINYCLVTLIGYCSDVQVHLRYFSFSLEVQPIFMSSVAYAKYVVVLYFNLNFTSFHHLLHLLKVPFVKRVHFFIQLLNAAAKPLSGELPK